MFEGSGGLRRFLSAKAWLPVRQIKVPAIIIERNTTTVVEPGWQAEITRGWICSLNRAVPRARNASRSARRLIRCCSRYSITFSCRSRSRWALSSRTLLIRLISRSVSISPAHCSMPREGWSQMRLMCLCISVRWAGPCERLFSVGGNEFGRGDVYALNDPFAGGTHLPDITVVTPVFGRSGTAQFWVASRGHHADIGGLTPGSMPPDSRTIEEEGVMITDFLLVERGRFPRSRVTRTSY